MRGFLNRQGDARLHIRRGGDRDACDYYGYLQPAVTPTTRAEALARLKTEIFDVLILGGGINGAGTARDLALRAKISGVALTVGLVDKNHFGSGTSGKNSHLIHGGLRYLKQFDFGLVRESLHERAVLLKIAPHLVEPLAFLMPIAGWAREIFYHTGLALYDVLGGAGSLPRHRRVSLNEVRQIEPGLGLPEMTGAAEYYDAKVQSARVVLENVFEAIANGAACANYVCAGEHTREDGVWRVALRDRITDERFDMRARVLIDAMGPWARDPAPRLVRGSHIILPRLNSSDRAIAYFEESGRILFFIPWGRQTLVGTTDVDHHGSADDVSISQDEVKYLRSMAARVFPGSAAMEPVASFSSLRPLLASSGSATKASRDHRIYRDEHGVIRITGGKFTTYRLMSEEAADLAVEKLRGVHVTADHALNGNTREAIDELTARAPETARQFNIDTSQVESLIRQYGVLTPCVLSLAGEERDIDMARLEFAIRHEMVLNARDFLEVSTMIGFEGRDEIAAKVGQRFRAV
jgi:glycerol-3-phosphate dehydrogenase